MLERLKPVVFFILVGSVAAYFVYKEMTRVGKPGMVNVGELAPDFTIKDQAGKEIKLSDYRGKVVFLNFWATWCIPCVEEMPSMEVMHKAFQPPRPFQMLAISVDNDWKEVNEFYIDHQLTLPSFLDPGRQVAGVYKVNKYPETFIIDPKGYVLKHTWAENWASPKLMDYVDSLIRQEEARAIQQKSEQQASTR